MWSKTIIGLLFSFLCSVSLCLNVAHLFPMSSDVYLLFGFIGGISIWSALMVVVFCFSSSREVFVFFGPWLLLSAAINGLYLAEVF